MSAENIRVKFLEEKEILAKATEFLTKYNPNEITPVPLEKIVEQSLGIKIVTVPNLKKIYDCDGYISSDFSTITFDDDIYNNWEERTNFTLAHELGHLELHQNLYNSHKINTIDGYLLFRERLGEAGWNRLEIQANCFAGFVLFPYKQLKQLIENCLEKCGGPKHFGVVDLQSLIMSMQETFGVSGKAALIQLKKYFPNLVKAAEDTIF